MGWTNPTCIWDAFYWPNMQRDLQEAYVPGCTDCQHNKSTTIRPVGPLHPLPVPDEHGASVAMDFVGPLPVDNGFDYILTITDCDSPKKSSRIGINFLPLIFGRPYTN